MLSSANPTTPTPPASLLLAPPALLTKALIRRYYVPAGERTLDRWVSAGAFPRPQPINP